MKLRIFVHGEIQLTSNKGLLLYFVALMFPGLPENRILTDYNNSISYINY